MLLRGVAIFSYIHFKKRVADIWATCPIPNYTHECFSLREGWKFWLRFARITKGNAWQGGLSQAVPDFRQYRAYPQKQRRLHWQRHKWPFTVTTAHWHHRAHVTTPKAHDNKHTISTVHRCTALSTRKYKKGSVPQSAYAAFAVLCHRQDRRTATAQAHIHELWPAAIRSPSLPF